MPGRTRGETRAMQESPRRMGLMSHSALAQGIATREAFDEAFDEHKLCQVLISILRSSAVSSILLPCSA